MERHIVDKFDRTKKTREDFLEKVTVKVALER